MTYFNELSNNGQAEIIETLTDYLTGMEPAENIGCLSDLHHEVFNMDYFIIGYYQAETWLKSNIGIFAAIGIIQDFENFNFGEVNTNLDNSESVVNMLAYIAGQDLIFGQLSEDMTVSEALEALEDL